MQPNRNTLIRVIGLVLSCVLVVSGILVLRQNLLAAGLGMTVFGALIFAATVVFSEKIPPNQEEASAAPDFKHLLPYFLPFLLWTASLALSLWVTFSGRSSPHLNLWYDAGWVASMVFAVAAMLLSIHWRFPRILKIKEWISSNRRVLLILLGILSVAVFMRLFLVASHPYPWSGDEASVGMEARRILNGEVTDFFEVGWSGQPNWSFTPTALSIRLFGETILAIRMVSIVEGVLAVLFVFLLARELFGELAGLLSAAFLAVYPIHLQFSRIGVNNIMDSLMVCLVLWLVFRAIRQDRLEGYLWAGLAAGLTFYSYTGTRLILGLSIGVLVYTCIRERRYFRAHLPHLGIYLLGLFLALAPIGWYFARHPDIFMTRIGQESIFRNGWLANTALQTKHSQLYIVWKQFVDTVLVFISKSAHGNFFNSPHPYLPVLASIFFLFGMVFAFVHFLETRFITLLAWFWSVILLGGVLTLNPPANTRLVMTAPAVALLLAVGLVKLGEMLIRMRFLTSRLQAFLCALVVVVLAVQNGIFYLGPYRTLDYFSDANGELAQEVGLELQRLGPSYDYYLFGQPRLFVGFPTTEFLAPANSKYDLDSASIDSLALNADTNAIFVATPDNLADLQRVVEKYPGGKWEEIQRKSMDEVLYYAYVIN